MVCDGDSKAHADMKSTYGDNVIKLDCIGHVGKRMYRNLENVNKPNKGKLGDGKFIGGGSGRMTSGPKGGHLPSERIVPQCYSSKSEESVT